MAQTKVNKTFGKVFTGLHTRLYRLTGGKIGGGLVDGNIIVLGHTGAKSGKARETVLVGGPIDNGWTIIASYSGHDEHPAWYHNLVANPEAIVHKGKEEHKVTARQVEGDERQKMWDLMVDLYPDYNDYKSVTERNIPVMVLEKV